jgi:hypothetical protein
MGCFITLFIFIFLGLIFGATEAILYLTLLFSARLILPYAVALALLIFAITSIIAAVRHDLHICGDLFIKTILITATIFLIFGQIVAGSLPTGILKIILAFIGSTSFWVMLTSYIGLIFRLLRRNPG